jgi:AraC-like DNA-binding protein
MDERMVSTDVDALSTALMRIKLRAFVNLTLDAGGQWGVDFPAIDGLTLNTVENGECWLQMAGSRRPVHLRNGDCFLLAADRPFSLASARASKSRIPAAGLFVDATDGVATLQGGGDCRVVAIVFRFEGHLPSLLFARLPPVIYIAGDSDPATVLRWGLERFCAELRGHELGRSLLLNHLAPVMLLQALRIYQSTARSDDNWLAALSDTRLAKVLEAMQTEFSRSWTLPALAAQAGMSRSGFALSFRKKMGVAPMDYLLNWRMQVACDLLADSTTSLADIASQVGYGSESAFSVAFTRLLHSRPGAWRRGYAATAVDASAVASLQNKASNVSSDRP